MNTGAYRYPNERLILAFTILLVCLVIALTAPATLCLSFVFLLGMVLLAYQGTRLHHRALLERAYQVSRQATPELADLVAETGARLEVDNLEVYITRSAAPNAYTFGLSTPKVVVLHSVLFEFMDRDELQFILGHEMGHVRLGHTWLNTLVGGMAGIPASYEAAALLVLALRWWNRACEYSADRAGLLACGQPEKAVSALVKLVAGPRGQTPAGLQRALARIETEDDDWLGNMGELLSTHPIIVRRITQLRQYAGSAEYRRLRPV